MEHECVEPFYPFKGYSAWFSSSVHPDIVKKWGKQSWVEFVIHE